MMNTLHSWSKKKKNNQVCPKETRKTIKKKGYRSSPITKMTTVYWKTKEFPRR
jgi:hypothetical protein